MNLRKIARTRRATKTRKALREQEAIRLTVHRSPRHIYAQIISADGASVLAAASTLEASLKADLKYTGNLDAATKVGELIAQRALEKGIERLSFDRSGYLYHGRVKALADAARKAGLKF